MQKQPSLPIVRIIQYWLQNAPTKASKLVSISILTNKCSCGGHSQLLLFIGLLCLWHIKTSSNTKERTWEEIGQGIWCLFRCLYLSFSFSLILYYYYYYYYYYYHHHLFFIISRLHTNISSLFFCKHVHTINLFLIHLLYFFLFLRHILWKHQDVQVEMHINKILIWWW